MSSDDRPRREVAHRMFATEYNHATYTYRESDEERAPNYLVLPSGARVNRVFVVGVLTEVEPVGDEVLRARVADPTGAFVVYAGQYQPDALAFFEQTEPPAFVAVTGKANTFQPDGSDRIFTSIRPESATNVDGDTRDRWVIETAERTLNRIAWCHAALEHEARDEQLETVLTESGASPAIAAGIPHAIEAYDTTIAYLSALQTVALDALRFVAGDRDEVRTPDLTPNESDGSTVDTDTLPTVPELLTEVTVTDTDPAETDRQVEEPVPEAGAVGEQVGSDSEAGAPSEAEPAGEPGETVEREAGEGGTGAGVDEPLATEDESEAPTDDLYELDDAEREEVQEEYGVEFTSGDEIPDAGEADIDAPTDSDTTEPEETAPDSEESELDLEDVVVDRMRELADGGAASRSHLIETVADEQNVAPDTVEDAIQDALMSGRCYESGDDELTPI